LCLAVVHTNICSSKGFFDTQSIYSAVGIAMVRRGLISSLRISTGGTFLILDPAFAHYVRETYKAKCFNPVHSHQLDEAITIKL